MIGFDPKSGVPARWSLAPEHTLGLIFWTKDPSNLIRDYSLIQGYNVKVHLTATGWEEVEKGAPSIQESARLIRQTAQVFGPQNLYWRFSPVPTVEAVVERFDYLSDSAQDSGLTRVYLSFLQKNDLLPETRSLAQRLSILDRLAEIGEKKGIRVLLCNEDQSLIGVQDLHPSLGSGVCAPPEDFAQEGSEVPPSEGCGCILMVDPFTVNEACTLGCRYCYSADQSLSPKKVNTTKRLQVIR